jgi:hypothetical protein
MNDPAFERWTAYIKTTAGALSYPPTPDVAATVRERLVSRPRRLVLASRRLAWAAAIAVFVLVGLLAVPQVRAGLLEVLRFGAVRILLAEPTPTVVPPTATPGPVSGAGPTATPSASPTRVPPTPTPLASVLDLAGQTTMTDAQEKVDFPIRLPTYPSDLGPPDRVFLQDLGGGPVVILVWLEPGQPDQVRLSLHALGPGALVEKGMPRVVRETTVNGGRALWTEGPYLLRVRNGDYEMRRLIEGHVLIWEDDEVTYRLETDLPIKEAVRVAESLHP